MPKLNLPATSKTAEAIYRHHERTKEDWRRAHLGASQIGKECARALWYAWRWVIDPNIEGRVLRLFDHGDMEEERVVRDLKALGAELYETDENGNQWLVSYHGGHFGGSCDGVGRNFPEAPKTWHLLEVKTSSKKRFEDLLKKGYKAWSSEYWTQLHVYMHGLKLKRALVVVVCKDDDRIHTERVHYDTACAEAAIAKAKGIIDSPEPLTKISDDPSFFKCKFCSAAPICHYQEHEKLERNCRTCVSSTPMPDGTWRCEHLDIDLSVDAQRQGCTEHLFIPSIVGLPVVEVFEEERVVVYRMLTSGNSNDRLRDERAEWREVEAL